MPIYVEEVNRVHIDRIFTKCDVFRSIYNGIVVCFILLQSG